jgi:hypothetical protein
MSRSQLRIAAVILIVLIVVVAASALDHLPGSLRAQIDAERAALATAQTQLGTTRSQVAGEVQSDPDLFNALPFGQQWPDHFSQAENELRSASRDVDDLVRLEKRNRHSDKQEVETLLSHEKKFRTQALADASGVQNDAAHWIDASSHLPQQIPGMERNYQAIHAFDLAPVTAAVQRAETDWPEKKSDLEARLASERAIVTQADAQWQSTAEARRKAAAGTLSGADAAALLGVEDSLETSAADLPKKADELKTLSSQLYISWDKLLVDMRARGEGNAREYDQQIRTVRTRLADAAAKTGDVSSDEQWAIVPKSTYDAMRNDLGMAIEHKPAGKFDYESEHVAQPAGMAYVAPPSQGSNQYGYWDHRDGRDFWVFYGQYALLRDLLSNHDYRPFDRYEWEDYRNYHNRGQTYYGHDSSSDAPKYGSQGTATQSRYSSSSYAQSGGFRDSQYASKSGGYRDSQYASPSVRDPNADHSPKTFGHSTPPSQPHAAPPPRTYHPAPAPSRTPMRSPGRSFGRRH